MQAAVPKYIKLQLEAASASAVPASSSGAVTQVLKIANSMHGEKPILLKIRLQWQDGSGATVQEVADVAFPQGL